MSKRLLIVGDGGVSTGFARLNHAYARGAMKAGWEVHQLALNYFGDPHDLEWELYPCFTVYGGDAFGLKRLPTLLKDLRPDLVLVTNDPWNIQSYLKRIGNTRTVGSIAVDGKNCRGSELNGLAHTIFWTQFGEEEAKRGGFVGSSSVVPLGVDLNRYRPMTKKEARTKMGLPEAVMSACIVGVVGRNQPRKRLDLSMMYFAEWIRRDNVDNAYIFLHVGPTGDAGYDLKQLGHYMGISNRVIIHEPEIGLGVSEKAMALGYNAFDFMMTTTQGEGWGLTHMEGMACGIPQLLPRWAALGEWAAPAALLVDCTAVACTPNHVNVIGGVADRVQTVDGLARLYNDQGLRNKLCGQGQALVSRPQYRWENIGNAFAEALEQAVHPIQTAVASA